VEGENVSAYEIRVKGHLAGSWSEWFNGLEITNLENGEALISGEIVDQAALHGVLAKVRDLGLPLVAVSGVGPDQHGNSLSSQHGTDRIRPGEGRPLV
jgi:hypothetical protein